MTKIISIANHKGGIGKTTSTINIGAALVAQGKKVLLIDLDPQANLTQSLGITNPEMTIYDNLRGEKVVYPIEVKKNFYIIPSSLDLSAAEIELSSEPGREYILKDILSKVSNQRPPSKDGGLTIGLKAGPVDKSTCFSSSHTLNPSGTSD